MIYKTNWLRGILGPMLVAMVATPAAAVPSTLSAFGWHSVFLDRGAAFGMGMNEFGEVAPATGNEHHSPFFTSQLNIKSVATNYRRTAFLRNDGSAFISGVNPVTFRGEVRSVPVSNISDIALTMNDAFIVSNGSLSVMDRSGIVTPIAAPKPVQHVAAGLDHIVVLFTDGTVGTYGANTAGQLGDGTTTSRNTLVQLPGFNSIVEVAAGESVSAFRSSTGEIFVFGRNTSGYLGIGTMTNQLTPQKVAGVGGAQKVAIGRSQTAYIDSTGSLWIAGWHNYIAEGMYNVSTTFTKMPIGAVSDVAIGTDYVLTRRVGNTNVVEGWGGNLYGKLGDGTNIEKHSITQAFYTPVVSDPAPTPVVAPAPTPVVAPAPTPVIAPAPQESACDLARKLPVSSITVSVAQMCNIPIYISMNECLRANRNVVGAGNFCQKLIIPADRGQQEKAPGGK